MPADARPHLILADLHLRAGSHFGGRLALDIESLGVAGGVRLACRWGASTDAGLIGVTPDGGLSLALLASSQPWWGPGCLRLFALAEEGRAGGGLRLAFEWEASAVPPRLVERLTLEFEEPGVLTFAYRLAGSAGEDFRQRLVRSAGPDDSSSAVRSV